MAKPLNGYPTTTDAVMALKSDGLKNCQIAQRLDLTANVVASLIASRRRRVSDNGEPLEKVFIAKSTLKGLYPAARARGISPRVLARKLLTVIAQDGMAGAVLDDGVKP